MPVPEILVIAPPPIIQPRGAIASKFNGAEKRCIGLAKALKEVAKEKSVHYFDAGSVTEFSVVDSIHLDENQHQMLGEAIANEVSRITIF